MTKEEAISWIEKIIEKYIHGGDDEFDSKREEALRMGISALEQNEKAEEWYKLFVEKFESCEDAISREAVKEQIYEYVISGEYCQTRGTDLLLKRIGELPSVTPNKPKGHWIDADGNTVKMINGVPQDSCWCSECKEWLTASDEYSCKGYYCPCCGIEMESAE